jgi:hypothetical protein
MCQSKTFSICKGRKALKFKCLNSHTFYLTTDAIDQATMFLSSSSSRNSVSSAATHTHKGEEWCNKCKRFYE